MSSAARLYLYALALFAALAAPACGGEGSTDIVLPPLTISTATTGVEIDPDGYVVSVDSRAPQPIASNATLTTEGMSEGAHIVELSGLSPNCAVDGENPRSVMVEAGATTPVAFVITCSPSTGSAQVITATTGSNLDPDGYSLLLDGVDQGVIGVGATRELTGLPAGSHTVGLAGVAANCLVSGESSRVVEVPQGGAAQVSFAVTCSAPGPTTATLEIVTSTTGSGTDPDGYSVLLDGADQGTIGVSATRSLAGLTPNAYAVGLSGLAANCEVAGANPRTASLEAGQTVRVTFAVTCTTVGPTTGTLQVAAATTGSAQDPDGYQFSIDGGAPRPIGTNQIVTLANVAAAQHTVRLLGLAPNCSVTGDNPLGVAVGTGETERVTFTVTCAATAGSLTLTITGLPTGASAAVTVSGPGSFSQLVAATGTLTGLTPGSYQVTAAEVITNGSTYGASVSRSSVTIVGGSTATVSVTYTAVGVTPTLDLRIDGLYITQSTQTLAGDVPLVAGRDGFLRVFVVANERNAVRPAVRVTLQGAGNRTLNIAGGNGQTPTEVQEGTLESSWNMRIPGELIQPGLSVVAEIDPGKTIAESNEGNNRFPAAARKSLSVQSVPVARIRFVSVQHGSMPAGSVPAMDKLTQLARRMHPLNDVEVDVRPGVFTSALALTTDFRTWEQVVGDLDALRLTDPDGANRIYFGLAKLNYGRNDGLVGIAFQGEPQATTALGWDDPADVSRVVSHELGHIWGRRHAPCGGPPPGTVDGLYPYPDGQIGVSGLDVPALAFKPATSHDIMGYCFQNPWTSDYTYRAIMNYRQNNTGAAVMTSAAPQRALLVWGRIVNGRPVLEPIFELVTRPALPKRAGPYSLTILGSDGSRLVDLSFDVAKSEGTGTQTGHFAFAVPLDERQALRLGGIRVDGPLGSVSSPRPLAQLRTGSASESIVARREGTNVVLRWDTARYPMIMIRDPDSGEVLSFGRGGNALVRTGKAVLDVDVSDGVRSQRVRLAISRS
jgi:hypothetical protein